MKKFMSLFLVALLSLSLITVFPVSAAETKVISETRSTKVEFDSSSKGVSVANASGGRLVSEVSSASPADVSVPVKFTKSGYYDIKFAATKKSSSSSEIILSLSTKGVFNTSCNNSNTSSQGMGYTAASGQDMYLFSEPSVWIDAGDYNVVPDVKAVGGKFSYAVDYVEFKPSSVPTISGLSKTRIELDDFAKLGVYSWDRGYTVLPEASGGRYIYCKWNQLKPDHSFQIKVSKSGNYNIVAALGERAGKSYVSGITVGINGKFEISNKITADERLGYGWDVMPMALYKLDDVYLEKGDYTIDVIVDMTTNSETVYKYTYDYIEFVPVSATNVGDGDPGNSDTFSVKFNTNGAGIVPMQLVLKGTRATPPTEPTKAGYTFGGWYQDSAFKTAYDFKSSVNTNITLYAKWNENASVPSVPSELSVTLDGKKIVFDQPPVIVNDRTLVPLRAIFEELGATVDWNPDTRTVTSSKGDVTISLTIGKAEMNKNGTLITLDVAPQIIGDRTLVPVRAIAESFNLKVDWEPSTRTVVIKTA